MALGFVSTLVRAVTRSQYTARGAAHRLATCHGPLAGVGAAGCCLTPERQVEKREGRYSRRERRWRCGRKETERFPPAADVWVWLMAFASRPRMNVVGPRPKVIQAHAKAAAWVCAMGVAASPTFARYVHKTQRRELGCCSCCICEARRARRSWAETDVGPKEELGLGHWYVS
jgi:hypothetical protein